jgi:hypothetical protein
MTALRRRAFIAGLGVAAWPLSAHAQQGDRVRRIGVLMPFDENDPDPWLKCQRLAHDPHHGRQKPLQ